MKNNEDISLALESIDGSLAQIAQSLTALVDLFSNVTYPMENEDDRRLILRVVDIGRDLV
jgi:hypothetical protein